MRSFSKENRLSDEVIDSIMMEEKPNQLEKIKIDRNRLKNFFDKLTSNKEIEETIYKALQFFQRYQERNKDRSR